MPGQPLGASPADGREALLVVTGHTLEAIARGHGDFHDWFGALAAPVSLRAVDVQAGETLPAPGSVRAVIVTGSPAMVSHREPWSEAAAAWLAEAVAAGTPALGVCYGHQLLAHALGGRVGPNPLGRQIGTVTAALTEAAAGDALFRAAPRTFPAQASHLESVLEPPPGAVPLATSPRDAHFALRFGPAAWGVQFHPEFSPEVTRGYVRERRDALRREGLDPDGLEAEVRETPAASALVGRFLAWVDSRGQG